MMRFRALSVNAPGQTNATYVLVWMVIGVIQEGSVNLTRWLAHVQTSARYAQSTQRRFSRWLHNSRIHPTHLYGSLIQTTSWQEEVLYLSFDTTMLGIRSASNASRWCIEVEPFR